MIVQSVDMIVELLSSCVIWFDQIFSAAGVTGLFLTVFFFLLLKRFLLDPLFSGAGSDKAKKRKE